MNDASGKQDSWADARWERKCVMPAEHIDCLRVWVDEQSTAFRRAFPERTVRSLYFDTAFLDDFQQNLAGVSERKKLRLRWYGGRAETVSAVLEVKCKKNQLGIKHSYPVSLHAPLETIPLDALVAELIPQVPAEAQVLFERGAVPSLLTIYDREYYVSADGRIRVTIDRNIEAFEQCSDLALNDRRSEMFPDVVVLELKYAGDLDNEVRSALGFLPGRLSRFSKYSIGLQAVLDV